ncbi:hypothetical protein GGR77_003689 [Xanthomonas translucens]
MSWIRLFILVNGKQHPARMGQAEVEAFLTNLATRGQVSAGTRNQALAALLFLYRNGLGVEMPWIENLVRASDRGRFRRCSRSRRSCVAGCPGGADAETP